MGRAPVPRVTATVPVPGPIRSLRSTLHFFGCLLGFIRVVVVCRGAALVAVVRFRVVDDAADIAAPGVDAIPDRDSGNGQGCSGCGPLPSQGDVQDQGPLAALPTGKCTAGSAGIRDGGAGSEFAARAALRPGHHRRDGQAQMPR
jgi:hypothetical protein